MVDYSKDDGRVSDGHKLVGVAVSQTEPLHGELASQRRGIPLPGLEIREAVPARGPRADSWYGSNGTTLDRVLSTAPLTTGRGEGPKSRDRNSSPMTSLVQEIIIGSDDRQQLAETRALPFAWICDLLITDAMGTEWLGTGWLAAPRLVITAGHCVYLTNRSGWASSIIVAPSRNGSDIPYTFNALELHSVAGWVNTGQPEYDYGAIILPAGAAVLGHFGFGVFADSELSGELVNVVGYPADKQEGTLWGSVRALDTSLPSVLLYDNDTYGGMSGSPVIRWDGRDYLVLGIHNYGDIRGNRATRITSPVFGNIQAWSSRSSTL